MSLTASFRTVLGLRPGNGPRPTLLRVTAAVLLGAAWLTGCSSEDESADGVDRREPDDVPVVDGECVLDEGAQAPDFLQVIGCKKDFDALASEPLNQSIPGAISAKTVFDQNTKVVWNEDGQAVLDDTGSQFYFQNSELHPIHYDFVSRHLSGPPFETVRALSDFNDEYTDPDRRFILGAVTYYEGPDVWALEIAGYDTATVEQIEVLFRATQEAAYFGNALTFHPTSDSVEARAQGLPADIPIKYNSDLFGDYQPLNLGTGIGYQLVYERFKIHAYLRSSKGYPKCSRHCAYFENADLVK